MGESRDIAALVEHIARHYDLGPQKVQFHQATELVEVSTRRDRLLVSLPRFVTEERAVELCGQGVVLQLTAQGRDFILQGSIEKAIRVKPGSETGRRLELDTPTVYYLVVPAGRPRPANVRIKRWVPSSFVPIINQARNGDAGRDCNVAVRAYIRNRLQRDRDAIPALPTDGLEVHVWPLEPGEITRYDPQVFDITGTGPRIVPLPEALDDPAMSVLDAHDCLFRQLHRQDAARRRIGQRTQVDPPPLEVQAMGARRTRQTLARGMPETQFVNVGPLEVMHLEEESQPYLTVRGRPRIGRTEESDPRVLDRSSRLYVYSLFAEARNPRTERSFRFVVPYRWHSANRDLTRLKPCDEALAYTHPPVNWLDVSARGMRLVHTLTDMEELLGRELEFGLVDSTPSGVTEVGGSSAGPLGEILSGLLDSLIGVDLFLDVQTADFSLTYGTVTDARGKKVVVTSKDTHNDHFPYSVPPYLSMIARIGSIQIVTERRGDEVECAVITGVEFVYEHRGGDLLELPRQDGHELLWRRLGRNSRGALEELLNSSARFSVERLKQMDRKQEALETFRLQESLAEARRNAGRSAGVRVGEGAPSGGAGTVVRGGAAVSAEGVRREPAAGAGSGRGIQEKRSTARGAASRRPGRSASVQEARRSSPLASRKTSQASQKTSPASRGGDAPGGGAAAAQGDSGNAEKPAVVTANEYGWANLLIRGANPFAKLPRLRRLTPEERRQRDGR